MIHASKASAEASVAAMPGLSARTSRRPASSCPAIRPIASTSSAAARSAHRSRAAKPGAGAFRLNPRAVAWAAWRRCAAHNARAAGSSYPEARRSAIAVSGRWENPLSRSIRARPAAKPASRAPANARRTSQASRAARPTRKIPCAHAGSQGRTSSKARPMNAAATPAAGQSAGQSRSHDTTARASATRAARRAGGDSGFASVKASSERIGPRGAKASRRRL